MRTCRKGKDAQGHYACVLEEKHEGECMNRDQQQVALTKTLEGGTIKIAEKTADTFSLTLEDGRSFIVTAWGWHDSGDLEIEETT